MKLDDLIKNVEYLNVINHKNVDVTGISYNSKTTQKGDIFVCLRGEYTDGHKYFKMAEENGAVAFVCEEELETDLPQVVVKSTRHQIADFATAFYGNPSKDLNIVGITGTNGKTTVSHLVQKIFENNNQKCGLIGTLGHKFSSEDTYHDAKHTTPQAPELQKLLRTFDEKGINNVCMEVSSHALDQNRVGGIDYKCAVITNLTQDHLDYHILMENYFEAKAILFRGLKEGCYAVLNADDEYYEKFRAIVPNGVKIVTYGIKKDADLKASNIQYSIHGAKFDVTTKDGEYKLDLNLNGAFSVYNTLCAMAVAVAYGISYEVSIDTLNNVQNVAGRFEIVHKTPLVIVDYAHTPDGLENVLKAAREITPEGSKLICLFGCGGDRDTTKRPKMGSIAEKFADKVIITSDNPRSENPNQIISDIVAGLKSMNPDKVFVEPDRGKAIRLSKSISTEKDVIVLAGKGHEDYQILADKTIHFDDREEARKTFNS